MSIHKISRRNFMQITGISALAMGLAACGGSSSSTAASSTASPAASSAAGNASYKITIAHQQDETDSMHLGAVEFQKYVQEKSNGQIEVEIFPNGQLGPEVDIIQSILSQGGCDITFTGETMQTYEPDLGMIGMPYLIQSDEHMDKVLNGEVGQELEDLMEAAGMKCLAYYTRGPRYITSNRKITCVADCNNLVIRTPAAAMTVSAFEALGAKPTPMALAEVFTSLGGAVKRAASLAGSFPAVVFDPGHLSLVKGAPEGRRKFLDAALCQLYPGYLTLYRRYVRALQQKNALLRRSSNGIERPYAEKRALLEVLNVELAQQGEAIQQRRRAYLAALSPLACANYEEFSRGAETLSLRYAAQFEPGGLAQLLRQKMPEELRAGQSLCGPHREDLDLLLDGQPAKVYASQGQQRSVVLSLKMAEAAAAASITGEHPVMLLDDVLSELDDGRKQYLLTRMREKQTFVTSCDDTAFLKTDGEVYRMNGGVLTKV